MTNPKYKLFSVVGLEIEYMLVNKESLDIAPLADFLIEKAAGKIVNEVILGDIALSNELVMHVIELKNNGPKPLHTPFIEQFQQTIQKLQSLLDEKNLCLLPGAAHPFMDPLKETKRWPYGNHDIYKQYDTIFNCQGHGWSNLQSMHINLPFTNDEEFCQLHSAIRLLLPLIPALTASSPFIDGKKTGFLDTRLHFYEKNQQKIPAITGFVIPEFMRNPKAYRKEILEPMYKAIRPYDREGILQYEWLNSRGAIPKFEYYAIEIRIIDPQECVKADIAIAKMVVCLLKHWVEHSDYFLQYPAALKPLKAIFDKIIVQGFDTDIADSELSRQWQLPKTPKNARDFWSYWIEILSTELDQGSQLILEHILSQGNLSQRLLQDNEGVVTKTKLRESYKKLSHCLLNNQLFGKNK